MNTYKIRFWHAAGFIATRTIQAESKAAARTELWANHPVSHSVPQAIISVECVG